MRQLACLERNVVGWLEVDQRPPGDGEVRVRCLHGVEKHGTMLAFVRGYANDRGRWDPERLLHVPEGMLWSYPVPLGNMQYGEVVEQGPGCSVLKPGDRVEVEHQVTVGGKTWTTRTVGTVVRTERACHGLHFERAPDERT
ncbi:MAG: hypothetical protein WHU10_10480, partial [Fimbriimonadales bacterium]